MIFQLEDELLDAWGMPASATPATQQTARTIAVRSLRWWDAFLGFRAGHDGLGRPLGVWKDKFDGVRFAVLLLAMRKLNQQIKLRRKAPGTSHLSVYILVLQPLMLECAEPEFAC